MTELNAANEASPPVVGVRLQNAGPILPLASTSLNLQPGDVVVVDTEGGPALGTIALVLCPPSPPHAPEQACRVIKKADRRDLARNEANCRREREAERICLHRIRERALPMKLIKVDCPFDGSKLTFYFAAEERVDFRDLVRDLAHTLHTRVEMRQIGDRDETKLVGGVAPCGRELCCSSWLTKFHSVSVKMAKEQGLSLNPSKLAGLCGRLKCCLRFEYNTYRELGRNLPSAGTAVVCTKGDGTVIQQNVLKQTLLVQLADGSQLEVGLDDLVERTET